MIAVFAVVPTLVWLCVGLYIPGMTIAGYVLGTFLVANGLAVLGGLLLARRS